MKQLLPYTWRQVLKRRLFAVRDMTTRLQVLRRAGFVPTGAIDGGAYHGDWATEFWAVFPGVPVWLIEPQPGCQQALVRVAKRQRDTHVVPVALSCAGGSVSFRLGETNSGIANQVEAEETWTAVPAERLDTLLEDWEGIQPNLLKLDLQGHELQALEGAGSRLAQFEVVILEVSVLRIGEVPIFHEVNAWMEAHSFRLYDVIPQYDRPRDRALWQLDAFFVRHDSALIASRDWS